MAKHSFCFLAIVAFVLLSGCVGSTHEVKAHLDEEFSLRIGQTASIAGENLKIRFDEVVEDSRCPKGVTCIWAGRVSCIVQLTDSDSFYEMVLTQSGLTDQYAKETYRKYQFAFRVEPYPEEAKKIPSDKYRLLLIVST